MSDDPEAITALLGQWSAGDVDAFAKLVALAYEDLRAIAHRRLAVAGDGDLVTTALVHEVYLRLVGSEGGEWQSRAHFYAFASKAMRHILVDHARRTMAQRHGGGAVHLSFDEGTLAADEGFEDVLGVDEALERLAGLHPRMAKLVELRFFGGLTMAEAATVLDTSTRTVEREWTRARAYLLDQLSGDDAE